MRSETTKTSVYPSRPVEFAAPFCSEPLAPHLFHMEEQSHYERPFLHRASRGPPTSPKRRRCGAAASTHPTQQAEQDPCTRAPINPGIMVSTSHYDLCTWEPSFPEKDATGRGRRVPPWFRIPQTLMNRYFCPSNTNHIVNFLSPGSQEGSSGGICAPFNASRMAG